MTRAEATVIVAYCLNYYPNTKADKEALVNQMYDTFKGYQKEAVQYLVKAHIENRDNKYYPSINDLLEIRHWKIISAGLTLRDPRIKYGGMERRINEAKAILHFLNPGNDTAYYLNK